MLVIKNKLLFPCAKLNKIILQQESHKQKLAYILILHQQKNNFVKKTQPKTQKKLCTPRHFRTSASGMHNTHFYSGTISVTDIFTII